MRAGTNSHILVLKQWCLAPAFGCDAQRALRRVVALGPHIPVLLACLSVSLHHGLAVSAGSAPVTGTALLFLCAFCVLCGPKALSSARRVHGPGVAPDTGNGGRSAKRRVGKGGIRQCSSWGCTNHLKKK